MCLSPLLTLSNKEDCTLVIWIYQCEQINYLTYSRPAMNMAVWMCMQFHWYGLMGSPLGFVLLEDCVRCRRVVVRSPFKKEISRRNIVSQLSLIRGFEDQQGCSINTYLVSTAPARNWAWGCVCGKEEDLTTAAYYGAGPDISEMHCLLLRPLQSSPPVFPSSFPSLPFSFHDRMFVVWMPVMFILAPSLLYFP